MGALSRLFSLVLVLASASHASAAKIAEGTTCSVKQPIALFKGAKGKKRVAKLDKDITFVVGLKKGKRFAVTLNDGRVGFVAAKMANQFCPKPAAPAAMACLSDGELPLFKKPKGKKRIGKVEKGTRVEVGKAFRYRSSVTLADGRKGFIPKKKLSALCVEVPNSGTGATAAQPATPATPAVPAQPGIPAQPGSPAQPATPAGSATSAGNIAVPTVAQPGVGVPVVPAPQGPSAASPTVVMPGVPGTQIPAVAVPVAPRVSSDASEQKTEMKATSKDTSKNEDAEASKEKPKDAKQTKQEAQESQSKD